MGQFKATFLESGYLIFKYKCNKKIVLSENPEVKVKK